MISKGLFVLNFVVIKFLCLFWDRYYNSRYDIATFMDVVYDDSLNESEKYDKETEGSERLCKVSTVNNLRRIYTNLSI